VNHAWTAVAPSILRNKAVFALREDGLMEDALAWLHMRMAREPQISR